MYQKSYDGDVLLIMQCDAGHTNGDLITYARYRVDDIISEEIRQIQQTNPSLSTGPKEEPRPKKEQPKGRLHVLFTIYLPRKYCNKSSFVSILGGDWICTHIDDFFPVHTFSPFGCDEMQLSDLFCHIHMKHMSPDTSATAQQDKERVSATDPKLYVHVQEAVKKASYFNTTRERMQQVNNILLNLLRHEINIGE